MSSRLLTKLHVTFLLAVLVTALVVAALGSRRIGGVLRADTESDLRQQAALLAELAAGAFASGAFQAELQGSLQRLGADHRVRMTVIADDGTVIADSHDDPLRMENHARRPEVLAVRDGPEEVVVPRPAAGEVPRGLVYCARVAGRGPGARGGFVRTARALDEQDSAVGAVRADLALAVAAVVLLACAGSLFVAWRLTSALRAMTASVTALAAGDLARRIPVDGAGDDLSRLAIACNALAEQLSQRIDSLAKERQEVVATLRSMVEGVVATDEDQRVLFINDSARRLLSIERDDCVGEPFWELTRVQGLGAIVERTLGGAVVSADEIRIARRRGDRVLELRSSPLRSDDDAIRGAVVVLHDVTDLRRLEQVRRDFVSNVSHELKTPLTVVRGYVETLLDDPDVDPKTRTSFLGKIREQTDRLTALVSDQLTLARIESREPRIDRERLDLRTVVQASVALADPLAQKRKLALGFVVPGDPVHVLGDGELLRQLVDNLVDNAIKYTPPAGRVAVRLHAEDGTAVLEVEDTGIGLSPEDQPRVFERFYRVDRARSRELGGTGLGLSIVKNVAIAHGGQVSVDSELGRGSTFTVRLPIAAPSAS